MKFFYLYITCTLVIQSNAFWFQDLIKSSYSDCLSSYSFMVNYKKYCDHGKSFIENDFDNDVDDDIFRSFKKRKNEKKIEEKDCYTAELLFEIGKSKDRLIKRAGCSPTEMAFRSNTTNNTINRGSKLFLTYTLECNKTITRIRKGKTILKHRLIQEKRTIRCEKAKLLDKNKKSKFFNESDN